MDLEQDLGRLTECRERECGRDPGRHWHILAGLEAPLVGRLPSADRVTVQAIWKFSP